MAQYEHARTGYSLNDFELTVSVVTNIPLDYWENCGPDGPPEEERLVTYDFYYDGEKIESRESRIQEIETFRLEDPRYGVRWYIMHNENIVAEGIT
jgi:hypothetical protein